MKILCAKHNISPATFHAWKRKFGGMEVNEARRLRALEEENGRLNAASPAVSWSRAW